MGYGTGTGMLEKWCALPNFSYYQQDGIDGWTKQSCNNCHIGASWNPTKDTPDCTRCHVSATPVLGDAEVDNSRCMTCHMKDTAKRGDLFEPEFDVHIDAGFVCQDCHVRDDGRIQRSPVPERNRHRYDRADDDGNHVMHHVRLS